MTEDKRRVDSVKKLNNKQLWKEGAWNKKTSGRARRVNFYSNATGRNRKVVVYDTSAITRTIP